MSETIDFTNLKLERNAYTELQPNHYIVMGGIKNGADIYDLLNASLIRQIETIDEDLVTILNIEELEEIHNKKFDGAKQMPYFGAILTGKGKKILLDHRRTERTKQKGRSTK